MERQAAGDKTQVDFCKHLIEEKLISPIIKGLSSENSSDLSYFFWFLLLLLEILVTCRIYSGFSYFYLKF